MGSYGRSARYSEHVTPITGVQALQGVACKLAVVTSGPSVVGRRTASRLHPRRPVPVAAQLKQAQKLP